MSFGGSASFGFSSDAELGFRNISRKDIVLISGKNFCISFDIALFAG